MTDVTLPCVEIVAACERIEEQRPANGSAFWGALGLLRSKASAMLVFGSGEMMVVDAADYALIAPTIDQMVLEREGG